MFNFLVQNKIISGVILILLLGALWFGLSSSAAPAPILQTDTPQNAADQQLVSTLLALRTVNLSGTIFSDPVFMSLQDFSTTIQPEPAGRTDPFAPLSQLTLPTASSTTKAQIFRPSSSSVKK